MSGWWQHVRECCLHTSHIPWGTGSIGCAGFLLFYLFIVQHLTNIAQLTTMHVLVYCLVRGAGKQYCLCYCSVWLQAVAKAFSQVLSTSPHVSVQAEVMDSVFDAFGKSDLCAAVVVSSGLLATLCALQPVFADKVGHSMQSGTACPANTTHLL